MIRLVKNQMKLYETKTDDINKIDISGTNILSIDLNDGWYIKSAEFDDTKPSNEIDRLIVVFEKKYLKDDEENGKTSN